MKRKFFRDGREMFQGTSNVVPFPTKVIPLKQRSEAITKPNEKPYFNVIPLINRSDRRVLKLNRISTSQLDVLSYTDVIMVVIPGAIVFVPKPIRKPL